MSTLMETGKINSFSQFSSTCSEPLDVRITKLVCGEKEESKEYVVDFKLTRNKGYFIEKKKYFFNRVFYKNIALFNPLTIYRK